MTVKELRKQTDLSQSRFAAEFGIPVRTLQQWEQNKSSPPDYVLKLLESDISHRYKGCATDYISKFKLHPQTEWKQCIQKPFKNCRKIHPLQQAKVGMLVDDLSGITGIEKIIIFGSSVTGQCHIGSDVDLYVQMKEDYNPISKAYPFKIDFWNNFRTDRRLKDEIESKGVVVYG